MKKDIEWLRERLETSRDINRWMIKKSDLSSGTRHHFFGNLAEIEGVLDLLDELDEPEVLSQRWIDEHRKSYTMEDSVEISDLQNLLVPKQGEVDQAYKDGYEKGKEHTFYKGYLEGLADKESEPEKVVAPQFVAEWYEENKKDLEYAIYEISNRVSARDYVELNEMEVWFDDNLNKPTETLIKMKLFGYDIEKEKLYRVEMHGTTDVALLTLEGDEYYFDEPLDYVGERPDIRQEFTESEIKDYDERFWVFAIPVEVAE